MSGPLFKQSSDVARRATLRLVTVENDLPPEASTEAPSPEQAEVARLQTENAALEVRLQDMERDWDRALEAAQSRAREEAADRHVRDEANLHEIVQRAVSDAGQRFDELLSTACGPFAAKLAALALAKLFELRRQDEDWLGAVIARRLKAVAGQSRISVALAPGEPSQAVESALLACGRGDVTLETDSSLPPGTARLLLKLGQIDIDPARGAAAMVALLEGEESAW